MDPWMRTYINVRVRTTIAVVCNTQNTQPCVQLYGWFTQMMIRSTQHLHYATHGEHTTLCTPVWLVQSHDDRKHTVSYFPPQTTTRPQVHNSIFLLPPSASLYPPTRMQQTIKNADVRVLSAPDWHTSQKIHRNHVPHEALKPRRKQVMANNSFTPSLNWNRTLTVHLAEPLTQLYMDKILNLTQAD